MKHLHAAALIALSSIMSLMPACAQEQAAPPTTAAAPDVKAFDKQYAEIRTQMQKMQDQMAKIAQTSDPAQRQKLLQEHWATMQAAMTGMRGLWGPGMMGPGMGPGPGMGAGHMMGRGMMGWGGMHGYYSNLSPEQLQQRQYMVDQYMGMQQIMLDHMLQHQQWMSQLPPAPSTPGSSR